MYQQGDKQALESVIEQNTGIVNKLVNMFYIEGTNSIDRDDLFQEGMMGLIAAANKYDFDNPSKALFITYAVFWIKSKINRFIRQKNTNDEMSLNTPIRKDEDKEFLDTIEDYDYSFENVEEKLYYEQLRKELEDVMIQCNTLREREILKLRYGWENDKCTTYEEIGEIFNIPKESVRYTEDKALRQIRNSSWGREKAKEYYKEKYGNQVYSIAERINAIDFQSQYFESVNSRNWRAVYEQ